MVQPVSVQFDLASEHQLAQVLLGTLGNALPQLRGVNIRKPHLS